MPTHTRLRVYWIDTVVVVVWHLKKGKKEENLNLMRISINGRQEWNLCERISDGIGYERKKYIKFKWWHKQWWGRRERNTEKNGERE